MLGGGMIPAKQSVTTVKSFHPPFLQRYRIEIRVEHVPAGFDQIIDSLFNQHRRPFLKIEYLCRKNWPARNYTTMTSVIATVVGPADSKMAWNIYNRDSITLAKPQATFMPTAQRSRLFRTYSVLSNC